MQCKVFAANGPKELEEKINAWLAKTPVLIIQCQLTAVIHEDVDVYRVIHTLVLFYTPLRVIEEVNE